MQALPNATNDDVLIGPAFVQNMHAFPPQNGALLPTLLGSVAEGIVLTQINSQAAQLSLDLSCGPSDEGNHQIDVEIPVHNHSPLHLTVNKECSPPNIQPDDLIDIASLGADLALTTKSTPLDKLIQMTEGRQPTPVEDGSFFNEFVALVRLSMVTCCLAGLFYVFLAVIEEDRRAALAGDNKPDAPKKEIVQILKCLWEDVKEVFNERPVAHRYNKPHQ